jgi:hypothetical protein
VKRRQDKRLKELDVHLNSQTLNEKRERERERERKKKSNRFPFHIVVLTDGHYIHWTFTYIHNYGDIQKLN